MRIFLSISFILIIALLSACTTTPRVDPDANIRLEIINLPREFNGSNGRAVLFLVVAAQNPDRPSFVENISSNTLSGYLRYEDGTPFLMRNVQRGQDYVFTFMLLNTAGRVTLHRSARPIFISSNTITLDFTRDFFETIEEALRAR